MQSKILRAIQLIMEKNLTTPALTDKQCLTAIKSFCIVLRITTVVCPYQSGNIMHNNYYELYTACMHADYYHA